MRTGELPIPEAEKALDTYLVLLADHSYNASTFSARVTASTGADIYCAITVGGRRRSPATCTAARRAR